MDRQRKVTHATDQGSRWIIGLIMVAIYLTEWWTPGNIFISYGYVLPILLAAAFHSKRIAIVTIGMSIVLTYVGMLGPIEQFTWEALINRSITSVVLAAAGYFSLAREALQSKLQQATEDLSRQNDDLTAAYRRLFATEQRLKRVEQMAAMGKLVASVAHEVGTPLHSVSMHLQILEDEPGTTAEMKSRIGIIQSQVDRVVLLIQDLLASMRNPQPTLAPVLLDGVIQEVMKLTHPMLAAKGIRVETEFPAGLPSVLCDKTQLEQVLLNLVVNAIEAMSPGGRLILRTARRDFKIEVDKAFLLPDGRSPDGLAVITVQDNGQGIAEEHQRFIFEPFFTTKEISQGSGLGLAISRDIITAHGGTLTVESQPGLGTTAEITLPIYTRGENYA
ncbi:ATP-binding protein [Candidatus Methylomirabilis sp.]|uniref:sensor histidine kinase n=1 Tax=Candidatus Methylomirabilis sp. TaxID=2032687 RepID=UPI002A5F0FD9|nr:ATP-binding protein [Candidatus Methylomirabilis sp.]